MNLFYSCVTSVGIVGAVWGLVFLQPQSAIAGSINSEKQAEQVDIVAHETKPQDPPQIVRAAAKANKQSAFADIVIIGNTQTTKLADLNSLMSAFNNNDSVNDKLYQMPSKLYVYYRNFSANYDSATITIGYNKAELIAARGGIELPAGGFEIILEKSKHSEPEILKAWQKIDYGSSPQAVIEVHYLNEEGITAQTELLVSYQHGA